MVQAAGVWHRSIAGATRGCNDGSFQRTAIKFHGLTTAAQRDDILIHDVQHPEKIKDASILMLACDQSAIIGVNVKTGIETVIEINPPQRQWALADFLEWAAGE